MKKYRPSNSSDGFAFIAEYCEQCARESENNPCEIFSKATKACIAMAFNINHSKYPYPAEWIYNENNQPTCTAFLHDSNTQQYRCAHTVDMFEEATQ